MWFAECATPGEVKTLYRKLAMQHHPDRGGDHQTMVSVNLEYEAVLKGLHGHVDTDNEGRQHTYYYNEAWERSVMEKVSEVLSLRMHDVQVWIVGTWVWVEGNTRPHKDRLKEKGFRWHAKRQRWYWRSAAYRTEYNPKVTFGDLVRSYGGKTFTAEESSDLMA